MDAPRRGDTLVDGAEITRSFIRLMALSPVLTSPTGYQAPCGACEKCEVRRQAVCAALEDDEVVELERIMSTATLQAGQSLVEEGDPVRRVFTLTAGMLRLSSALADGRRQITGFLIPGDYLGLADDDFHSQTAEAVVPSILCAFQAQDMRLLADTFPKLRQRLNQMTRRALRQAGENQMILGRLGPVEKVASFLLLHSQRIGDHGDPINPVALMMTRTDIADYLGLTIETVSRSFTKLRARGLIRLPGAHLVEIVDRQALAAVAGLDLH